MAYIVPGGRAESREKSVSNKERMMNGNQQAAGVNGLGVAGMIIGLVAVLFVWVPFCGIGAIPLALIGLLLAGIGMMTALGSRKTGLSFPVAGIVVSGLALIVGITQIVLMAGAVAVTADAVAKAAEEEAARTAALPQGYDRALRDQRAQYIKSLQDQEIFGDLRLANGVGRITTGSAWAGLPREQQQQLIGVAYAWCLDHDAGCTLVRIMDTHGVELATYSRAAGLSMR
jgi:hypothetical protein